MQKDGQNILPPVRHDTTFSIVKAIGMVCIVAGHAAVRTPVCTFVYLFHVALFFFAAGYFFRDDLPQGPVRYLAGRLRRLYVPFVGYGVAAVLLHNLLLRAHVIGYDFAAHAPLQPYDLHETLVGIGRVLSFTYYEQWLAPAWFLSALFFSLAGFYVVTRFCRRYFPHSFERARAAILLSAAAAAMAVAAHEGLFRGERFVCRIPVAMGLIYLGRLYALHRRRIPLRWGWAVVCFGVLAAGTAARYRINVGGLVLGNPLLFLLFTLAGCYLTLTASRTIAQRGGLPVRLLDYLGRNTLTVMMLHMAAFKLVSLLEIALCHYPIRFLAFHPVIPSGVRFWWIPYTVAGIALPLGIARLWDRMRRGR